MAADTKEKRFEQVKKRLAYTKQVYADLGVIGEEGAAGRSDMHFLMRMYGGEQWDRVYDFCLDDSDRVTVNKVFALANQLEARVAARPAEVVLLPRGRTLSKPEKALAAGKVQALLNYDIDELDMEEQAVDAFDDNMFAPFGAVRHMFTPKEEHSDDAGKRMNHYRHEKPDKPFIRRYAPWDCLLDPRAARYSPDGGMRYVFFRDFYTLEQLRKNPGTKLPRDASKLQGSFRGRLDERPTTADMRRGKRADPDENTLVQVWTYYDAIDRTWMQLIEDGMDRPLRDEADWPIPWEWLPVSVFVANRRRNSPNGVPILSPIAPLQEELNKIRSMVSWLARTTRRLIGVDVDRMEPSEVAKIENSTLTEILGVKGPLSEIVQNLQAGGLDPNLLLYEQRIEQDMREEIGLSLPGRGQRINVESAEEAANVQAGEDVNVGRIERRYEKFWTQIAKTHFQARRHTMQLTGPEVVRILGTDADGALRMESVDPKELHGDYDFVVVAGSTRERSREREESVAGARLQLAATFPDIMNVSFYGMRLAEAQGVDPREALMKFARTAGATRGLASVADNVTSARSGEPPAQQQTGDPATLLSLVGGQ